MPKDKTDLIYDIVCRLEDKLDARLDTIECKVTQLDKFKTKILAISGFITIVLSVSYNFVKDWFHVQ